MSIDDLIKDVGVDVEIWRNNEIIEKTKAKHNYRNNTFDFMIDMDIRIEDTIHAIDSNKTYKVADVITAPKKSHKIVKII